MTHRFTVTIERSGDMDAAYVRVPIDIKKEYGKGRLKVQATFAGLTKKDLPRGRWRELTEKEVGFFKMI